MGEPLGQGGFGITYIGRDINLDMRVAIKEFYPTGYVNRNNAITMMVRENTVTRRRNSTEATVSRDPGQIFTPFARFYISVSPVSHRMKT